MRDAFARGLYAVAKQNPKVFIIVADISPAASMDPSGSTEAGRLLPR